MTRTIADVTRDRFPFAHAAINLDSYDRDVFAVRIMGARWHISPTRAENIAEDMKTRAAERLARVEAMGSKTRR